MDVSTLFAAPNTAASTAALSFGALAGTGGTAAVSGDGLEGLDSFNQLLGNFLSLTGGEVPAGALGDGTVPVITDGTTPMLTEGAAAMSGGGLLKGLNGFSTLAGTGTAVRGMEGRWAQSGLNLLAGGALAGQEMDQEVVAFLNDLSSAISADGSLLEASPLSDAGSEPAADGEMAETLVVSQGDVITSTDGAAAPMVPVPVQVIPLAADPTAPGPGPLGLTLTVAGTGLKTLPSVPVPEDSAIPAATPVIPRLTPVPAQMPAEAAASTPPRTAAALPAGQADQTAVTGSVDAGATATPAAAPIAKATGTTPPAGMGGAAPPERTAAIALPPGLVSDTGADTPVVTAPSTVAVKAEQAAEPLPASPSSTAMPAAPPSPAPLPSVKPDMPVAATEPRGPAPAPVVDAAPAAMADGTPATAPALTQGEASAPPVATTPKPTATPAPTVTVKTQAPQPGPAVEVSAGPLNDAEPLVAPETTPVETTTATPHAAASPATITPRPAVTVARAPAQASGTAQAAAARSDTEVTAETADAAPVEDEDASNQRMLAPRHVGAEARAEAQADMAGPAQTAGQNPTATRTDIGALTVNGEREDNLLTRAVTAAGKTHDGDTAEGETGNGADPGLPTDLPDGLTGTGATGEPAKAQGTDFAQSLRQSAAPHRPNAYMPPAHQMALQVQRAIQDGNERLSIRLNPQELGRIDVQLEIGSEGKLRAKVMVENPQTLEMLRKDAGTLEKALQDAGLQTDQNSLTFSLQDNGDQARERQERQEQSGHGTPLASIEDEQEDPAILAQTQILELGRVDVRV